MLNYLYQTSDLNLFLIISAFFISISIMSLFLINRYFPLHLRYQDNAVIGCVSALVGVIYGVLAGFATAHLINANTIAIDALQREANAVADMYRDSRWLTDPAKSDIQAQIKRYLDEIISVEWPLMNRGELIPHDGDKMIEKISSDLRDYKINNSRDHAIISDLLIVTRNLYDARQQRILASYSALNPEIWMVIILGSFLTLCISYLFGVNFYLHIFTVLATALMLSATIYLLISLDKPFEGSFIVGPDTYQKLVEYLGEVEAFTAPAN